MALFSLKIATESLINTRGSCVSSKNQFSVNRWFQSITPPVSHELKSKPDNKFHSRLPSFKTKLMPTPELNNDGIFKPSNFLVPGWSGESLKSKNSAKLERIFKIITNDVFNQILKIQNLPKNLKTEIYEDFISFAESLNKNDININNYKQFWDELFNEKSLYREDLDQFLQIYSYRVTLIYFYKVRFIAELSKKLGKDLDIKNAFYPNSYLISIFGKGGANDLPAQALELSIYSWFRPSSLLKNTLLNLINLCFELTVSEIYKTIALEEHDYSKSNQDFSHTMSHKNFGLFINALLINFPIWEELIGHKLFSATEVASNLEIISTKFCGDHLSDIALSHWLAQENNKDFKWDQILCPDFKSKDFGNNYYFKLCNELQFLTFLTEISHFQSDDLVNFISKVFKGHTSNKKNTKSLDQKDFLFLEQRTKNSTYDRIILNLTDLPQNNAHHFLCQKIKNEHTNIKDQGLLYVISNQKLFVPSQKNRVQKLLQLYNIEAILTLEAIKGKGEIGNYVYILSKKSESLIFDKLNNKSHKDYVFHFTFNAELESFYQFSNITDLLQGFLNEHCDSVPPLYHQEISPEFKLSFHQDCIMDARLIHSQGESEGEVTHPNFFKNLMETCIPFDQLFNIEQINDQKVNELNRRTDSNNHSSCQDIYPVVCVVNLNEEEPRIQLISTENISSAIFEWGVSNCYYFGLRAKWHSLDLNLFKEYFSSSVGEQIIRLTFTGTPAKIKSKLAKLLIPKFFIEDQKIPNHLEATLNILKLSESKILEQHPIELKKKYQNTEKFLKEMVVLYPKETINNLSLFCNNLKNILTHFEQGNFLNINFNNPVIKNPLTEMQLISMIKNEDIHPEFMPYIDQQSLDNIIDSHEVKTIKTTDLTHHAIELSSNGVTIVRIYSDYYMICFINYLLGSAPNLPLKVIFESLCLPSVIELKGLIDNYLSFKEVTEYIYRRSMSLISTAISSSINKSNT